MLFIAEHVVQSNVICGNSSYHCDAGQTCCQLSATVWGCCPYDSVSLFLFHDKTNNTFGNLFQQNSVKQLKVPVL